MNPIDASGQTFTIRVLRYDGTEHRRWNAKLARRDGPLIVLDAEFDFEVQHAHLGHIARGTRTVEYYWQDKWYNVFHFPAAERTRFWYCNINLPPIVAGSTITYTDLDLDLLVQPDLSYQVLDSDEFEYHARIFEYSREVRESARQAVTELISLIESREFPFSQ